ncbi:hypothetical protein GEMRC1_011720 [Eukaryota sp. GEM-RC1]
MNVSFVTSLVDSEIPNVIQVNYSDLDVSCSSSCELVLDYLPTSTLLITFTQFEPGVINLEFYAIYFDSNFRFSFPILVESIPLFEVVDSNIIVTSDSSLFIFYSYSNFDLNATFFIDNSIIEPTTVDILSSSDSFFVYKFQLNLTSLPVFEGEYIQNLYWSQIGFQRQLVTEIKFFNFEFSSNDHVTVFEHRDVSVDFRGNLTSNLTCFIEDEIYFGQVIDNFLVCKNVRIPTFRQYVNVDVYYEQALLNSFEIHVEAFLEEICFMKFVRHSLINSSEIISTLNSFLIFDGSRCCSVDLSHCSEFISKNMTLLFLFPSKFDLFHIVITTNSSCTEIDSDLPFELTVNNQTLSTSVSCQQIPSGYSFASMCEIDLLLPKTSEFTLVALEDVYLLEIEFYGYKSNSCFKPFSFGKGVTSVGEVIDEDVQLRYDSVLYSISEFKEFVIQQSTFGHHLCYRFQLSYILHSVFIHQ